MLEVIHKKEKSKRPSLLILEERIGPASFESHDYVIGFEQPFKKKNSADFDLILGGMNRPYPEAMEYLIIPILHFQPGSNEFAKFVTNKLSVFDVISFTYGYSPKKAFVTSSELKQPSYIVYNVKKDIYERKPYEFKSTKDIVGANVFRKKKLDNLLNRVYGTL